MKKLLNLAIILCVVGCYAPLNNSGVSTNKSWLEIPAKKTDFDGKQFDSCYQFRVQFVPADATAQLDLQDACIDACCWRSQKDEVVWDLNKNFEQNLKFYGRADYYTPGKITLKVTHANWLNTTAVHVSPRGAISASGKVKLKHKVVEDPARLAQAEQELRRSQTYQNAWRTDQNLPSLQEEEQLQQRSKKYAQTLLQRSEGTRIDRYFYELNKSYQQKGYIFLIGDRLYTSTLLPDGTYQVSCYAQVQTGTLINQLQSRTLSCGLWKADLSEQTISPLDSTARKIKMQ